MITHKVTPKLNELKNLNSRHESDFFPLPLSLACSQLSSRGNSRSSACLQHSDKRGFVAISSLELLTQSADSVS